MKFEIVHSRRSYNFKKASLFLFGISLLVLIFRMYLSFDLYKEYFPHEVEVNYYKHNIKSEEKRIDNGKLYISAKTVYRITSKNYAQYFILEFNPSDKNPLSLFFCLNFFVITSIIAIAARKSTVEKLFTPELYMGLNILRGYVYLMMFGKFALAYYFRDYIEQLSNYEVSSFYLSTSTDFLFFQITLAFFAIFLTLVRKGIELQMEQDLTV